MGVGEDASPELCAFAEELGSALAGEGFKVLTGGRRVGVMEAALKGAKSANGQTICILPGKNSREASSYCDEIILTGMGNARNAINALSSDLLVFIGMGPGTISEFGLAIKENKPVILGPGAGKLWDLANEFEIPPVIFKTEDILEILEIIRRKIKT